MNLVMIVTHLLNLKIKKILKILGILLLIKIEYFLNNFLKNKK